MNLLLEQAVQFFDEYRYSRAFASLSKFVQKTLFVYLLFGPYKGTQKYAMMVETLFYQYLPSIVGAIVPFFSIADTIFHAAFVAFSYLVQTATYNAPYTDEVAIRILLNLLKIKENYTSSRPISWNLIGAGISASIAKRVATSPDFYGSFGLLVDGLTPDGSATEGRNYPAEFTGRRHNIINVRTSSIFSTDLMFFSTGFSKTVICAGESASSARS